MCHLFYTRTVIPHLGDKRICEPSIARLIESVTVIVILQPGQVVHVFGARTLGGLSSVDGVDG